MRIRFIIILLFFYNILFSFQVKGIRGPISSLELIEPRFSPNNNYISATTPGYKGIIIFSFPELKIIAKFDANGIGYNYKWSDDENFIICRETEYKNNRKFYRISLIDFNKKSLYNLTDYQRDISIPLIEDNYIVYYHKDKQMVININNKLGKKIIFNKKDCISYYGKIITNWDFNIDSKGILLAPKTSYKGDFIVAKVAGGALKIFFENGRIEEIGNFEMHSISRDGKYVIMADTKDDGYRYISSKLYIYDMLSGDISSVDGLERFIPVNPDLSNNNEYILFEDVKSGKIHYCELAK